MVPTQASPTLFSHLSCRQAQSVVLVVTGGPASARLHKHRCMWDAGNVVLIQVVINWPFFKVILLIQLMRRGISDPTFNFNSSTAQPGSCRWESSRTRRRRLWRFPAALPPEAASGSLCTGPSRPAPERPGELEVFPCGYPQIH